MTPLTSLCVFCGSSPGYDPIYENAGKHLGRLLAENGIRLVFGAGGTGVMGAVSRGCLDAGGEVVGIIPQHLVDMEIATPGLTELIVVPDMHTRKRMMFDRSDAFCALPGGFGTLDETFEILTWRQLNLHDKPIILCSINNYWQPFMDIAESMQEKGFIRPGHMDLFRLVSAVEDVLPAARDMIPMVTEEPTPNLF
jgi:uncharacterized protein (TIGR00730 family)